MDTMKVLIWIIAIILLILLLRLGEIYTQLARYQKYWDRVNAQPIANDDIVYVAFGDSAAQGVGASKPEKGYVSLIAEEIAKQTNKPVKIINLSKSGARTKDVLDTQLPKYNALNIKNKKVITVEIGANDITTFDNKQFEREMNELMGKLPKGTVISDIPTFKGGRLAKFENNVIEANKIMNKLADARGIKLAPLNRNVERNHSLRTFGADLFHPSNYAYKTNWAPAFLANINCDEI